MNLFKKLSKQFSECSVTVKTIKGTSNLKSTTPEFYNKEGISLFTAWLHENDYTEEYLKNLEVINDDCIEITNFCCSLIHDVINEAPKTKANFKFFITLYFQKEKIEIESYVNGKELPLLLVPFEKIINNYSIESC